MPARIEENPLRRPKVYTHLTKRVFRSELTTCLTCGTRLRRYATLAQRTVITLDGPIRVTHCGYRCPNPVCPTARRSYRSAAADALALPGFTFGLDFVILVGQLRLAQQHSLDQAHQAIQVRLAPFALTISRRETLYLFEAYCTLLRAAEEIASDSAWHDQVRANGGLIGSIDGREPDKGNETVYLVRDVLTGRVLAAENVGSSDTATLRTLLQPICELKLPVLGAISDAQESILQAVASLWPAIPHQVCQFHMRPHLIHCYDLEVLPRTNNDMEGFIRAIKTRYRRISGRKNGNCYLLRSGRRVAYYEAQREEPAGPNDLAARVGRVSHAAWRKARAEQRACQEEQLKQYRFRHRRTEFLAGLEARWAATHQRTGLLP